MKSKLAVALDFENHQLAEKLMEELKDFPVVWKVGLQLFCSAGPLWVKTRVDRGDEIFLDLKLYDIPTTVQKAAYSILKLGVSYLTLHLSGGEKMIRSVVDLYGRERKPPKILGVSVLTSFDQKSWDQSNLRLAGAAQKTIEDSAFAMFESGKEWGVDGIVCSAYEVKKLKEAFPGLTSVVPGIRPEGFDLGDQKRVMTPCQAQEMGADLLVIGRPITQSDQPKKVVETIFNELKINEST
ncbi:MAG: orotidine-5'-phosphate decarboxylase [Bdellovibrionaceae bacterium]|nr:orotidine-5'-phosphate decarboxylase [Pseudobdellovibrionaceae bacterium]|tara:strand:+ start:94 stop:813 length:720 start_codon:yes stop_codon:yes gene_type:complete